ncbi:MAG TPA: LON peptidase substrate-binding domain-containing protein [Phycisphaerales bacterium]|nr:LON peptidase substrate-binding domain-containing protein [Phycisphaerales bacterium]
MSGDQTIQVNFGTPKGLFPLDGTKLMPHGILPLHVFEPRYRQLVKDALDELAGGAKQFAMATFHGDQWQHEYHGRPAIRPVVCLGQIMQHAELPDGSYGIVLQGLCRCRVVEELPPDEEKLYRRAMLRPLDLTEPDEEALDSFRHSITEAIEHDRLADLRGAQGMLEHLKNDEIPTSALVEVLGFQFLGNPETRYRLLACDDAEERADIVRHELLDLEKLLRRAHPQRLMDAPKGCHWN